MARRRSSRTMVGVGIAAAVVVGAGVYFATRPGAGGVINPLLATLTLQGGTTAQVGVPIAVNGIAKDANGNGLSGVAIQLLEGTVAAGTVTSGAGGAYAASLTFATAGTFAVTAQSGSITSLPLTIVVSGSVTVTQTTIAPAQVSAHAGTSLFMQASVTVTPGSNPVGINMDWYLDGVIFFNKLSGPSGGLANVGLTAWSGLAPPIGTHTMYVIAQGIKSNIAQIVIIP